MPSELPEDIVGQGQNQKNATGEGFEPEQAVEGGDRSRAGVPAGRTGEGERAGEAQKVSPDNDQFRKQKE